MATDIFNHQVAYGGAFSADAAMITFGNFGAGLLTQELQYQYQQKVSRIYELGTRLVYLVSGRAMGQASISRVLGPKTLNVAFYQQFGSVCNAAYNNLSFSAVTGCSVATATQQHEIGLNNCVLEGVGGRVQSEDMLLFENLQMLYLCLTIT